MPEKPKHKSNHCTYSFNLEGGEHEMTTMILLLLTLKFTVY